MESKKVSVNKMDRIVSYMSKDEPPTATVTFSTDNGEVEVVVKHMISFDDFNQCVYDIVSQCFQEENGQQVFYAAKKEFAYHVGILTHYTNIKTSINQAKLYQLVYSDVYEEIVEEISPVQLGHLYTAVVEQLEFEKNALCKQYEKVFNEKITQFDKVLSALSGLSDIDPTAIQEIVEKLKSINEKDIINTLKPEINTTVLEG